MKIPYLSILIELLLSYERRYPTEFLASAFRGFAQNQESCLSRHCFTDGHFTVSAWVTNRNRNKCLLTYHRKLCKWLQLGGHIESEADPLKTAIREVEEESGLVAAPLDKQIFDLDKHLVPKGGGEPSHFHYDVRFLLEVNEQIPLIQSNESIAMRWFDLGEVRRFTKEKSIARMVDKHRHQLLDGI